jgi:hypothetical protein
MSVYVIKNSFFVIQLFPMKRFLFILTIIMVVAVACNKDKFTTVPQVSIKSISPSIVNNGNIISMKGNYTDQEGDLDSVLIVYKKYNGTIVTEVDTIPFPFSRLDLPPNTKEAEISIDFQYNTSNPNGLVTLSGVSRDTTATLGLILLDEAKNRSNYAESQPIRLIKP